MTEIPSLFTIDTFGQRAREALRAVSRHKPRISASWSNADALYSETLRIRHDPPPMFPGIPTSATKAAAAIDTHARATADHRDRQLAAADAGEYAQRTLNLELNRALPDWYALLAAKFTEAAETFTSLLVPAITADTTDEQLRDFRRKQAAAVEMHTLLGERIALGAALDESPGLENKVWVVAAPPTRPNLADDDKTGEQLWTECVSRWVDLERWWPTDFATLPAFDRFQVLAYKGVPLTLAQGGQVRARQEAFGSLKRQYAGGVPTMTGFGDEHYKRERLHLPLAA